MFSDINTKKSNLMSIIRADSIKNRAGTGAPDFPNGITVTGVVTATTRVKI